MAIAIFSKKKAWHWQIGKLIKNLKREMDVISPDNGKESPKNNRLV